MSTTADAPPTDAAAVVTGFLRSIEDGAVDAAMELLTDDAVWINVSLPTVRGRPRIDRLIRGVDRRGDFRVSLHNVAVDGNVVLTERTDAFAVGRFEPRFWVYGRFELREGRIAVWRDSFDWLDMAIGLVRAAAGVLAPSLNRPWPG